MSALAMQAFLARLAFRDKQAVSLSKGQMPTLLAAAETKAHLRAVVARAGHAPLAAPVPRPLRGDLGQQDTKAAEAGRLHSGGGGTMSF